MNDKARFEVTHYPLPKNAQGKTFYDKASGYARLKRAFRQTIEDHTVGVLWGEAGVGKTTAIRNLTSELARPDYNVLYLCNTSGSALDLYRTIAGELGVRTSHRRGQLWTDIKRTLVHMVDEKGVAPVVVLDEAQLLSDAFLSDLAGFLNFAFDSRELMTVWLVGLPPLAKRLHLQQHEALRTRIAVEIRIDAMDRATFGAAVEHGFKIAGATSAVLSDPAVELLFRASRGVLRAAAKILRVAMRVAGDKNQAVLSDPAVELLFRASRGVLRAAAKILRVAMRVAGDKNQAFIDEHVLEAALTELGASS